MKALNGEETVDLLVESMNRATQIKTGALEDSEPNVKIGGVSASVFGLDDPEDARKLEAVSGELGLDYRTMVESSHVLIGRAMLPMIGVILSGDADVQDIIASFWLDGFVAGVIAARKMEAMAHEQKGEES